MRQSRDSLALPERIIEKSLVSDQVVIDTIVAKYCDALPLYRQSVMLQRDLGIDISRATMVGWVMRVGELLTPMVGVMRGELLRGSYIQVRGPDREILRKPLPRHDLKTVYRTVCVGQLLSLAIFAGVDAIGQ